MPRDLKALLEDLDALSEEIRSIQNSDQPEVQEPGRIVKFDIEKRLVYAEVYMPEIDDAHGHRMSAEEIEKMAHNFMANARTMMIDVNHDNQTNYGCAMVESFIARKGDPDFIEGSWVACVFVGNDKIWEEIKKGKLTGFSFEGMGYVQEV